MDALVPLVELTRGGTLECMHFGAIAVCDAQGRVRAHTGDPHWVSFTRSTLKPLQALPFLRAGGAEHFGFSDAHVALLCASHGGEPMHVQGVQAMLDKAGVTCKRLQCGCHVPGFVELGVGPRPEHIDERHHNCSGKHAGFLAYCVQHGLPLDTYLDPSHPLQQAIRRDVAQLCGLREQDMRMGIDGCSAPNYAMPLSALATSFARLAAADGHDAEVFTRIGNAMSAHPEFVSGTRRNDDAFMRTGRGDWITKVGADGMQVVASRSRGEALVIKVIDGNGTAVQAATVEALDQLGWLDEEQRQALQPWRWQVISSVRGAPVGERKPVFRLAGAS